ncbi:MAG: MATE family efflux transporter [Ruminococcaceae bacterium]|nr:MATE family efflux transporter [Oscillospiraceae bacterium]
MNKDLTVGKPETVLWKFCMPLFASIIFQQLYNLADSFVAGKFIGEEALAAVGNSYEITLIYLAFAVGCNIGCSVVVARLFGAKQFADMKTAVYTTMISCGVLCLVLMTSGLVLCNAMLQLIHTPQNIFADSKLYMDIYILGLPFVFFYNIATGIFSALGNSKTPLVFLAVSSTSNIVADVVFVTVFDMGVAGVAWATFICQGLSCVAAVFTVFRHLQRIKTDIKPKAYSWQLQKKLAAMAVPSILQQSSISVGNIIIQGIINTYGSGVIAGYAAAVKLNNLVITSYTTLGNGISSYTAQNIGAGKLHRVPQGLKAGIKLVWTLSVPFILLYCFGGRHLAYFFINNPTETALTVAVQFLLIVAPFYPVVSAKMSIDGVFRGSERMRQFLVATTTDLLVRVVLAKVFSDMFGAIGIWCAWPVGWTTGLVLNILFYRKQKYGK